jgi:glutamine amidotransferase
MLESINKKISVIDYGIGNISNVLAAIDHCGGDGKVITTYNEIEESDYLVLPGVGAFKYAMEQLISKNMVEAIKDHILGEKPFLGICLGMQLMLEKSYEFGEIDGLGIIKGNVISIKSKQLDASNFKIPHIGWNKLIQNKNVNSIYSGLLDKKYMYFVHSYYANCDDQNNIIASTDYNEILMPAMIRHNNSYGCQFHPEKSGLNGLNIIKRFLDEK